MSKFPFSFLQNVVQGPAGTKCAPVVITPDAGTIPINPTLSTTQTGGHIFYRIANTNDKPPQHTGDSAISPTIRIGSNTGLINVTGSGFRWVQAVCYQSGFLDSDITIAEYDPPSP